MNFLLINQILITSLISAFLSKSWSFYVSLFYEDHSTICSLSLFLLFTFSFNFSSCHRLSRINSSSFLSLSLLLSVLLSPFIPLTSHPSSINRSSHFSHTLSFFRFSSLEQTPVAILYTRKCVRQSQTHILITNSRSRGLLPCRVVWHQIPYSGRMESRDGHGDP